MAHIADVGAEGQHEQQAAEDVFRSATQATDSARSG